VCGADPLEELVRIVGEADRDAPRPRSKPTSARRIRSNRRYKKSGRFFEAVAMWWRFGAGAGNSSTVVPCLTY
jgi:hypothetical protein